MDRQADHDLLPPREPRVHASRRPRSRRRSSAAASGRRTSSTTVCSRTGRAERCSSRRAARPSTTCSERILGDVEASGFSVVPFDDLFADAAHWRELEAMRDRFVAETEADLAKGGEHVRVRAGKEFVVRLHSYGVELGLDDPWFRAVASHRLLDLANAYLEMWSKLEYVDVWYSVPQPAEAAAHLVAALAPRLQRQAPAEGLPLPRRRRRGHGPVPVRARKPARRAVRGRLAVGAARQQLPDGGGARGARSRRRRSRRSRLRRGRSSSATRPASTAAASRRPTRACSRRRRTRRPPRSRR